jgi:hypothetical protein
VSLTDLFRPAQAIDLAEVRKKQASMSCHCFIRRAAVNNKAVEDRKYITAVESHFR